MDHVLHRIHTFLCISLHGWVNDGCLTLTTRLITANCKDDNKLYFIVYNIICGMA